MFDAVIGLLGLLVGSFLNVVIYRVPAMMDREERDWYRAYTARNEQPKTAPEPTEEEPFNLIQPGSSCPKCGAPVKPHQNIPILSYLLLRGRCASCGVSIALRYPIIEGLTRSLSGAANSASNRVRPEAAPTIEPTVAPLQSVSSPAITEIVVERRVSIRP